MSTTPENLVITVALQYRDLRRIYHPYYDFGDIMSLNHRHYVHFLNTAKTVHSMDCDPRVYLAAQFSTGEVPLPYQLYSKRAIKKYEDFISSRIAVSNPGMYVETLSRAWNIDIWEVRRMFKQWL